MFTAVDRDYVWTYPLDYSHLDGKMLVQGSQTWSQSPEIAVYIHVPFCITDCPFCVFNREKYSSYMMEQYVLGLAKEISAYGKWHSLSDKKIAVIYFGGGTASLLKVQQIESILDSLKTSFAFSKSIEITVECHPNTANLELLLGFRRLGVDRISFGIQSFNETVLQCLGIIQTPESNRRALSLAHNAGFSKINMDILYRVPGQTIQILENDLTTAIDSGITGISCYSLELTDTNLQGVEQQDDRIDRQMFDFIAKFLQDSGMKWHAQPDFCFPGFENRHLDKIWKAPQDWSIGFGPSAVSGEVNGFSFHNVSGVANYLEAVNAERLPILGGQLISKEEAMARFCILGVRMKQVSLSDFRSIFGISLTDYYPKQMELLERSGMISLSSDSVELTVDGMYYVDNISKMFFTERCRGKSIPWGQLNIDKAMPLDRYPHFRDLC